MAELWLEYALLSAGVYAAISLIDKCVSDAELPDPAAAMFLNSLPRFLTFVVIGFVGGNVFLPSVSGLWARRVTVYLAIGTGALYALGMIAWYRGIANADVSRFVPLYSLRTVFTTVLAFLFFGETYSWAVYGGILTIVAGAVLISLEDPTDLRSSAVSGTTLALGLLTAVVFATIYTSLEGLTGRSAVWSVLFWIGVGGTFVTLDFAVLKRREIRTISVRGRASLIVNGGLSAVAFFVFTQAVSVGPVSLVTAVVNLDAVLVFLGAIGLSRTLPRLVQEDTDLPTLLQKGTATVLILGGGVAIDLFA